MARTMRAEISCGAKSNAFCTCASAWGYCRNRSCACPLRQCTVARWRLDSLLLPSEIASSAALRARSAAGYSATRILALPRRMSALGDEASSRTASEAPARALPWSSRASAASAWAQSKRCCNARLVVGSLPALLRYGSAMSASWPAPSSISATRKFASASSGRNPRSCFAASIAAATLPRSYWQSARPSSASASRQSCRRSDR
mmetsp:Transcript_64373/g.178495  ORF Transcript_64373/g.178495 Transcript_64373/m.178495 type:complete len:204 (+) Transcript_64373:1907-2518(+)